MDQPCPRANRPSHTIEVNVQALVALKLSHSSGIEDTAETSDTKLSHEKKHRLAGSGSNIRATTPPIEKGQQWVYAIYGSRAEPKQEEKSESFDQQIGQKNNRRVNRQMVKMRGLMGSWVPVSNGRKAPINAHQPTPNQRNVLAIISIQIQPTSCHYLSAHHSRLRRVQGSYQAQMTILGRRSSAFGSNRLPVEGCSCQVGYLVFLLMNKRSVPPPYFAFTQKTLI